MAVALYLAGSWGTISNLGFLGAAIFNDILLVRLSLIWGYIFLIISAAVGFPDFPHWGPTGIVSLGVIMWSVLTIVFHAYAFCCLALDERPIKFNTEDEEQLWRLFYRRSGMGRLEFREVLRRGQWRRYDAGDTVMDVLAMKSDAESRIFVVVEGCLGLERNGEVVVLYSGELANFTLCNLFGVPIGFEHFRLERLVSVTDCLVISWRMDQVEEMACRISPSVEHYWRCFILSQLGSQYNRRLVHPPGWHPACSRNLPEAAGWFSGARSRDLTDPLEEDEVERRGWRRLLALLAASLDPRPPLGLRHTAMPQTGQSARSRIFVQQELERVRTESTCLQLSELGLREIGDATPSADNASPVAEADKGRGGIDADDEHDKAEDDGAPEAGVVSMPEAGGGSEAQLTEEVQMGAINGTSPLEDEALPSAAGGSRDA